MSFRPRTFQAKLVCFMAVCLVLLQAATFVALRYAGQRSLQATVSDELQVGARVFSRTLASRGRTLTDTARVLTADFAFREAIASGDGPTIQSVLANHGDRIKAERAFLVSLEGTVDVDTARPRDTGRAFAFPALVERAGAEGEAFASVSFTGRPYQIVVVPVLAPQPIAFVGFGFPIERTLLAEVSRLTGVQIAIWSEPAEGAALVSSAAKEHGGAVPDYLGEPSRSGVTAPETIQLGAERYVILHRALRAAGGGNIHLLLKRSVDEAWQPFQRLELQMFVLSSLALLATLIGAMILSRTVSRPLKRLVEAAQRIEKGDYTTLIDVDDRDEIGRLASAFNDMRVGIGNREAKILYQATHDSLTDLPNRTLFLDRLASAITRAKRAKAQVGMLMLDLDRFKDINDTLGHQFGDELLRDMAKRLLSTVRESDTIARLGGDEFAVLLEWSDELASREVAARIRTAIERPFTLDGVSVVVTASVGVGLYPRHADDEGTLLKRADVAMYDAKRNQRQVAVYEPQRDEHSVRRLAVLSELTRAIDHDELTLHYQPSVDVDTRRTVHAEALVRWIHPSRGTIPPDEFIPQAERSGKIRLLTKWVLRRAIRDCVSWNRSGLDVTIAVNLSALDLSDPELVEYVCAQLEGSGLAPSKLVLEVTESAVMKDASRASEVLDELKALGIVIAIDDFGTGYSSLAQLRRLPVGELKIDKSFVVNLSKDASNDAVIVHSTIELAHNLGLAVVAEGVESEEGWNVLRELGCDMAQGYFISRPLEEPAFVKWMKESSWGQPERSGTLPAR